jgi:hypothetical protein
MFPSWIKSIRRRPMMSKAECNSLKDRIRVRLATHYNTKPKLPEGKMKNTYNIYMTQSAKKVLFRKLYGGLPPNCMVNNDVLRRAVRHAAYAGIKIRVRYRLTRCVHHSKGGPQVVWK